MKIKIKCSKGTILKAASIAIGALGAWVSSQENKLEIKDAVNEYMKANDLMLVKKPQ